jgi:menaquinone-dependent protoporphyrinogen oxidase
MKPVLVLYATREGHTHRIAEHVGAALRFRGRTADVVDVKRLPDEFSLDGYCGAVLAASIHIGKHEPEMVRFVKRHREQLERIPTAFLSVSLSEAGAENSMAPPERRAKSAADAERMIQDFLKNTAWHPEKIRAVAGALMYTKYNFLVRFVMKRIARHEGGSTDTSRDHEYTDWQALDHLAGELVQELPPERVG